jgi:hypothetical protein
VTRKFGFVAAALQVLATVRSVAEPPKIRTPCASRASTLNSRSSYACVRFVSVLSISCTDRAMAELTGPYIVTGVPSIGLKTVIVL